MIPFRDEKGSAKFAKAKTARVDRRVEWAWDTITGAAKKPASIGFYPKNERSETRWACLDFDAHDGNAARARRLAMAAFDLLYRHPQFFVVLGTSGSSDGWHLFVFTREFHPCADWTRLLRQAAKLINAPIEKGVLEIFPSEARGSTGYGVRAPGVWNPKNDSFGLIAFENVREPLQLLHGDRRESNPFLYQLTARGKPTSSLQSRRELRCEEALRRLAILKVSTRHEQMVALVSELYRFYSRPIVEALTRRQFETKTVETAADLKAHLVEFGEIWDYWIKRYEVALSEAEKAKAGLLRTDEEREAFRLAWGFANIEPGKDFAYSTEHFALNLGITIPGASKQRRKLCGLGVLQPTAPFIPNRAAARYLWIANQ